MIQGREGVKQKIEQLSKGMFEYRQPEILLSEERISISVVAGSTYHGCFTVSNSKGSRMKGVLYSSSRLFVLPSDKFIGEQNVINFHFVADYVDPEETMTGEISIITECGETVLPFEVHIIPPYCDSSVGTIRDLFQFTNLAKSNWDEAVQVFCSEEFSRALYYYDKKLVVPYRHLMMENDGNQALEEFLVAIRKKLPVLVSADKTLLEYNGGEYNFLDKITITRNTWGYMELKVRSDMDFLKPEHAVINTGSFHGTTCEAGFVIEPAKMHAGLNCGYLYFEGIHQTLKIPVTCHCKGKESSKSVKLRRKKQYDRKLLQNYIRFRLNKISVGRYTTEAENLLLGLSNTKGAQSNGDALYRIHLQLAEGKETQAKSALTALEEHISEENVVERAAFLYLSALCSKQTEVTESACREIGNLRLQYPEYWQLLWFLIYIDKSLINSPQLRMEEIKKQFCQGGTSPVLYYEAAFTLNEAPEELRELKLFELQILHFSIRHQFLSKETMMRLNYLVLQETEFNTLLLRLLQMGYEYFHEKETLSGICHLLILGSRRNPGVHEWYAKGIREQVKTVGIQEYYLMSAEDTEELLEHSALTYFAYNCELPVETKGYLYANIVKHREEYAFILKSYENDIQTFVLQMLEEGRIDRNLAVLYDDILPRIPLTVRLAEQIPGICFYYEIECRNPGITGVCCAHKEVDSDVTVLLKDGRAEIELYTENAEVLLTDAEGKRYLSTIDYTLNKLVHLESMLEHCCELSDDNPHLLLNLAEKAQYYQKFDEAAVELRKRVARIPNLNPEYVREYIGSLINYYYENYEGELLESYLLQVDLKAMERQERIKIIEYMIIRDLYNVALQAMDEYGFEGIDVKRLMKLCSRLLLNAGGMEKVEVLVAACHYVFQAGKYDETILGYLTDYFYGTTMEMYEVWKSARTFEIDTVDLEERLLGQMLFAESYISNAKAVFSNYYRGGTNRKLIRAFLSYYAYKYLLNDRLVEQEIFDIMRRETGYEENDVCLLAIIKWYSTKEQLNDAEVNFVDYHLYRFEQKGIILPFFKEFKNSMRIPQTIYDKYFVEYRTDPNCKVVIHYSFEDERNGTGYRSEEMADVCYGIFVKEFVLFCNETLQYYITEIQDGTETITESKEVRLALEQTGGEDTKYYQLNLIITAREMQDEKTALKLIENYVKTDYAISQLFRPL